MNYGLICIGFNVNVSLVNALILYYMISNKKGRFYVTKNA